MIICQHCGAKDDYTATQKSNNLVATCNNCNRFIKNIPTDKPKLFFGKYKNVPIEEIDDLNYLKWAKENLTQISNRSKNAINERIYNLENLLR